MNPAFISPALLAINTILVVILIRRPAMTVTRGGKILAFLALFLLPLVCLATAASDHLERSKQTQFCLSCHVMEPYGKSLYVDDKEYLAAAHFQNHRVPPDMACYTCHTDYVLYGGIRSKLRGLRHVYVQYIGTPSQPIKLYNAYNNRECLHCHLGARTFEEGTTHGAMRDDLISNQMSCLTAGCHSVVHNVEKLKEVKFWKGSGQ